MSAGTPVQSLSGLTISPEALERLSPAEREAATRELAELEAAFKENPLLGYRPFPKQVAFHRLPTARSRLYIGGNRGGKTTSTHVDTIIQCVDVDMVPDHLRAYKRWEPPFYCRIVGPDLTRWLEGVSLQKFREWCPRGQLKGNGFERGWDKQQLMLRFKNGSWIQFMSNDQDLDKFAGTALHRVVYDEPPRQDIRRECLMRLIDYGGEELFGLTPTEGMSNWLFDDFYDPWEKLQDQDLSPKEIEQILGARVVLVDMDDNPHLSDEDKEWALSGLSKEERDGRKTGRFVAFSGLIYHEFSKSRHVIPSEDTLPEGVELFAGIDAGLRRPAVVYAYLDYEDTMVVFDEIAPQDWTIQTLCAEILKRNAFWGITPRWYVIDPSVRNKNPQTGRSDQQEYRENGISAMPGQNDVRTGINKMKMRLESDPPKLLIQARCEVLLSEFKKYRWRTPAVRTENAPREEPVKRDDHCFPAGTLVDTAEGRRPIETIRPGDLIWTRRGLFPALLAGRTQADAETRALRFEDGRELCGTPNHPVYVSGKGWTRLDAVRYGDRMLVWAQGAKRSSGTESPSTAIPTRPVLEGGTISSPRRSDCTVPCGSFTTGRFRQGITSTTSTRTLPTTTSPTLSVCLAVGISRSTTGLLSDASERECGWPKSFAPPLSLGTDHPTGERGTRSTLADCFTTAPRDPMSASNAARSSRVSSSVPCASVPTSAGRRGVGRLASMTLMLCASGVARSIGRTATPRPGLAPLRVVANLRRPTAAVYNLTVLGPPEYFANGLLVHNCLDALRYVVMQRPLAPVESVAERALSAKDRWLRKGLERLAQGGRNLPDSGFGPGQWQ